jgi:hypothetical protein
MIVSPLELGNYKIVDNPDSLFFAAGRRTCGRAGRCVARQLDESLMPIKDR